jgi:hypothetical protein
VYSEPPPLEGIVGLAVTNQIARIAIWKPVTVIPEVGADLLGIHGFRIAPTLKCAKIVGGQRAQDLDAPGGIAIPLHPLD